MQCQAKCIFQCALTPHSKDSYLGFFTTQSRIISVPTPPNVNKHRRIFLGNRPTQSKLINIFSPSTPVRLEYFSFLH